MRRVDSLVGRKRFSTFTAGQLMQQDVVYFSQSVKAQSIAAALATGRFESVPIVNEERRPIGMVSEFELLRAVRRGASLDDIGAEEIMASPPVTVRPECNADDMLKILEEKHLLRLPVVDEEGRLIGMIARRDLLHGYLESQTDEKVGWM